MNNRQVVAFIPVRGGSKSIPQKNIKLFCGKPLVYWVVKAASDAENIDVVYVATDDDQIRDVVADFRLPKVVVIGRSAATSTDTATTESAMLEFAENYAFDHLVLIQATSPVLEQHDLNNGIDKYFSDRADSLVSVVRQKRFIWKDADGIATPVNYDPAKRPRRQEWEGYFVENGAFYICSKEGLLENKYRLSGRTVLYEMNEDAYFEVDEPSDWHILEQVKSRRLQDSSSIGVDFSKINLLVCDVDGVLTDAGMYYSSNGDELKKFNTRDGKGLELIRNEGIKVMFLTSENIELVQRRADKLKVDYVFMGIQDKKKCLDEFFQNNESYSYESTAYIGDDINDLEVMGACLFSVAPYDGCSQVISAANYVSAKKGGCGCVRDICDLIISRRSCG